MGRVLLNRLAVDAQLPGFVPAPLLALLSIWRLYDLNRLFALIPDLPLLLLLLQFLNFAANLLPRHVSNNSCQSNVIGVTDFIHSSYKHL